MTWNCEAYGEGGPPCFFSPAVRSCSSPDMCSTRMAAERARVFARINEMAVDGDEDMAMLAELIPTPGELLNGR